MHGHHRLAIELRLQIEWCQGGIIRDRDERAVAEARLQSAHDESAPFE